MKKESGLIHIYCGDGKGKTTAALGLAVRAAGAGLKVCIMQFLKSAESSELSVLEEIENIKIIPGYKTNKFTFKMSECEKKDCKEEQTAALKNAAATAVSDKADMLILDEAIGAVDKDVLCCDVLIEFLKNKPEKLEVVLTGRNPAKELTELADYITEMNKIKHPFDLGVTARKGIEK